MYAAWADWSSPTGLDSCPHGYIQPEARDPWDPPPSPTHTHTHTHTHTVGMSGPLPDSNPPSALGGVQAARARAFARPRSTGPWHPPGTFFLFRGITPLPKGAGGFWIALPELEDESHSIPHQRHLGSSYHGHHMYQAGPHSLQAIAATHFLVPTRALRWSFLLGTWESSGLFWWLQLCL